MSEKQLIVSEPSEMMVTPATTLCDVEGAWRLVYQVYLAQGLISPNATGVYAHRQAVTGNSCVLRGVLDGRTVSTITMIEDSPSGLPVDCVAPELARSLRHDGCRLIEASMFASSREPGARSASHVLTLVSWAIWFAVQRLANKLIIGVHPKHSGFYRRILGFRTLTSALNYPTLHDAPVTVMALLLSQLRDTRGLKTSRGLEYVRQHPVSSSAFASCYRPRLTQGVRWLDEVAARQVNGGVDSISGAGRAEQHSGCYNSGTYNGRYRFGDIASLAV